MLRASCFRCARRQARGPVYYSVFCDAGICAAVFFIESKTLPAIENLGQIEMFSAGNDDVVL
jgi:hypothetical protein